jgi:hypothetical protein
MICNSCKPALHSEILKQSEQRELLMIYTTGGTHETAARGSEKL